MPQLDAIAIDKIRRTVGIVLRQPPNNRVDHSTRFGDGGFWAKILGSAVFGDNPNRFQYSWIEQRETAAGWEDMPDGLSGTTTTNFALNSIEAYNPDTDGMMGNSVNTDTTSTTLSPVQGFPVVWMRSGGDTDGNTTYRFTYENSVDCGG